MPERAAERPAVFTIPAHRSFADALAAGLIQRFGKDPLGLARGRILLPNNRAVRAVTEAFVRASGSGLLLPRLIPIGDPELDERIGGALEPIDDAEPIPPAIDPLQRLLTLAELVRGEGVGSTEALRLAQDLARTLDLLLVEEVDPRRLADAAADAADLALHWQVSLERLRAIIDEWPRRLAELGAIDLADRRNRLLAPACATAGPTKPPRGLHGRRRNHDDRAGGRRRCCTGSRGCRDGMVVVPALSLASVMPEEEWDALGPDEQGSGEQTHPQYHLKLLLDRMGVARGEVQVWPASGRAASPAVRARAVANAMTAADFSDKWSALKPPERRLTGVRAAEFADAAAEAQGIALALRRALETPGQTAALVTPDRMLARRVSALLQRWGIEADDSAGRPLSETPAGTLLLGIAAAAAEELAPVPLLALLKHPLVGGEGDDQAPLARDACGRSTSRCAGRGPAAGPGGPRRAHSRARGGAEISRLRGAWAKLRPASSRSPECSRSRSAWPSSLGGLSAAADRAGGRPRRGAGPTGGWRPSCSPNSKLRRPRGHDGDQRRGRRAGASRPARAAACSAALWRASAHLHLGPARSAAAAGGLHGARRAQRRRVAGARPRPIRGSRRRSARTSDCPGSSIGSACRRTISPARSARRGCSSRERAATRARRRSRRASGCGLQAMTGGVTRDTRLERLAAALDDPGELAPAERPRPQPAGRDSPARDLGDVGRPPEGRSVRLLRAGDAALAPARPGRRRPQRRVEGHRGPQGARRVARSTTNARPRRCCRARGRCSTSETIHPMLRALWQPRLIEAINQVAEWEREDREAGRLPLKAEIAGETEIAGVTVNGKADRIDRLADGGLAIVDYKTGKAPAQKAVDKGFALQLGLLGLIARAGGFPEVDGEPEAHEYWSLTKDRDKFGKRVCPDKNMGAAEFLAHAEAHFRDAAGKWLTGDEPFTAKLHPAYAPYGDYDQLMRLEEWYGRE